MTKHISLDDVKADDRYLRLLAEKFPSISSAATEIINLEAILFLLIVNIILISYAFLLFIFLIFLESLS